MANEQNLKPFTSENQPQPRGRRKGIPNHSTVLKKLFETKVKTVNPLTGKTERLTFPDVVALNLMARTSGD